MASNTVLPTCCCFVLPGPCSLCVVSSSSSCDLLLSRLSLLFHSCFLPSCPLSLSCLTVYYQCYFLLVVYVSQWYYNCFTINTCLVPCLRRVYSFEPRVAKLAALLPIIYNCHFNLSQKEYKAKLCINFPSKLWVSYV